MNEQQTFQEAMAKDPADEAVRLVYADWLQEHDNEPAAHRLRWWVDARKAILREPFPDNQWRRLITWGAVKNGIRELPREWVHRLYALEFLRCMAKKYRSGRWTEEATVLYRQAIAAAERHALLITEAPALTEIRRRTEALWQTVDPRLSRGAISAAGWVTVPVCLYWHTVEAVKSGAEAYNLLYAVWSDCTTSPLLDMAGTLVARLRKIPLPEQER